MPETTAAAPVRPPDAAPATTAGIPAPTAEATPASPDAQVPAPSATAPDQPPGASVARTTEPPTAPARPEGTSAEEKVSAERQRVEIKKLGSNIIHRKFTELQQQEQRGQAFDENQTIVQFIGQLPNLVEGDYTNSPQGGVPLNGKIAIKLAITETNVLGTKVSTEATVQRIIGRRGDVLICEALTGDGRKLLEISHTRFVQEEVMANSDAILAQFPQGSGEREAMELYIKTVKEGTAALPQRGTPESQALNETIKKAAQGRMPTIDDLTAFHRSLEAGNAQEKTLTPDQLNHLGEIVAKAAQRGNLVDYETMTAVFESVGWTPAELTKQALSAQQKVVQLEQMAAANPNDSATQQLLGQARTEQKLYVKIAGALSENGQIRQFFAQLVNGEAPAESASQVIQALRSGDINQIAQAAISLDPDAKDLDAQERARRKAELMAFAKKSGLGLFALLALLFYGVSKGIEGMNSR